MLTVSLLDFLNSSGNSNHNVSNSVHHFWLLLFSIALMRDFGWFYDISRPHMHSSPIFFFPPTFSSPVSAVTKTRASIIA
jgi:hypothetical protein